MQSKFEFLENATYISIIERGQNRDFKVERGYEIHHIVPRSLGGEDIPENLTKLTIEEHLTVHYVLAEMGVPYMEYALLRMLSGSQWNKLTERSKQELLDRLPNLKTYFDKSRQFLIRSRTSRGDKMVLGRKSASLRKKYVYRSEEFQNWFRLQQEQGNFLGDAVWEKAVNVYLKLISKTLKDFPEAEEISKKDRISSTSARARERYIYKVDSGFQEWKSKQVFDKRIGWNRLVRRFLQEIGKTLLDFPEYVEKKRSGEKTKKSFSSSRMHRCMRTVRLTKEFQNWFASRYPDRYCPRLEEIAEYLTSIGKSYQDFAETEKIKKTVVDGLSKAEERETKRIFVNQSQEFNQWYVESMSRGRKFQSKYQAASCYLQHFNLQLGKDGQISYDKS